VGIWPGNSENHHVPAGHTFFRKRTKELNLSFNPERNVPTGCNTFFRERKILIHNTWRIWPWNSKNHQFYTFFRERKKRRKILIHNTWRIWPWNLKITIFLQFTHSLGSRSGQWTDDKHRSYLTFMEENFVKEMFENGCCRTTHVAVADSATTSLHKIDEVSKL
jgi:hypothetical protein